MKVPGQYLGSRDGFARIRVYNGEVSVVGGRVKRLSGSMLDIDAEEFRGNPTLRRLRLQHVARVASLLAMHRIERMRREGEDETKKPEGRHG